MGCCQSQFYFGIVCTVLLIFHSNPAWGQQHASTAVAASGQEMADLQLFDHSPKTEVRQVLLKNGNLISGTIIPSGMHLKVRQENGSEIVLPKSEVDATFQTRAGVFDYLISRLAENDLAGHRQLFHWCMRYQLWPQAEQTLDRMQMTSIPASQWLQLQSQLETARRPLPPRAVVADNHSIKFSDLPPPTSIAASADPLDPDRELIDMDPMVRPVSYETMPINRQYFLSQKELDQLVDSVSLERWQKFQSHIEPLLLRDCNNAGCHESSQRQLTLIDSGIDRTNPTRLSQQNMFRVLQFLEPHTSEPQSILVMAQTAHGQQRHSAWSPDARELQLLVDWVQSLDDTHHIVVDDLLQSAPRVVPKTLAQSAVDSRLQPSPDLNTQAKSARAPKSAAVTNSAAVTKVDDPKVGNRSPSATGDGIPEVPSLSADTRTFVPKDPFDAEIYNRFFWRNTQNPGAGK